MRAQNNHEKKISEALGHNNDSKPFAQFFDHAEYDEALSEECGRPRFNCSIYLEKIPTSADLIIRDRFHRKMIPADKLEFAEAWERYSKLKRLQDNFSPAVQAIPGIDTASFAELKALEIASCEDLVEYEGDLDVLEPLRETAKQIMEIGDALRKKRDAIRAEARRQVHENRSVPGASPLKAVPNTAPKGYVGTGNSKETFNYTFQA